MRRLQLSRQPSRTAVRRRSMDDERAALESELISVRGFLDLAPKLREEARFLVPPSDYDRGPHLPDAPNRTELRRIRLLSYFQAGKLIFLLSVLAIAIWWFLERVRMFVP